MSAPEPFPPEPSEPSEPVQPRPRPFGVRARRVGGALLVMASTLGLLSAASVISCHRDQPPAPVAPLGASLELASGEVVLVGDGPTRRLLSNTPLPVGATLRTEPGARALIQLGDGTRVFMRDATEIVLGDGIELANGEVWLEAPPLEQGRDATLHRLGSTSVAISDGGASLRLDPDTGAVEIYVAQGLGIVNAPGGRTEVDAGERATVAGDGAPTVEPVTFWDDWTGGMGDVAGLGDGRGQVGSGSLYAIDHLAGAQAMPLSIQRQDVQIAIDSQVAETEVDQVFFNPASSDVEGYYWFTIPEDAMLVGFALEVDGQLIEGEVVERKRAAQHYEASIVRRVDPALLEWIDARTVRARIYPIPAAGTRRIVVRYQQLLAETEGTLRYRYPLRYAYPGGDAPASRASDAATIEEFSLAVQLRGDMAKHYTAATRTEAKIEGRERDRITMRRSGFTPRADFELELSRRDDLEADEHPPALRVDRLRPAGDQADYVMLRWLPDARLKLAANEVPRGEVVVVVDTSAGSDPGEHQAKLAVAEALLRSLSADDRFALVGADLGAEVLYPSEGLAEATPEAIADALERIAARGPGGATDLGAVFEQSLERIHGLDQPAIVYVGDGVATSGEVEGEALAERLQRSMSGSRARLFTVAVGRDVDEALLRKLAEVGGGRSLRVEEPGQAVLRALELSGALKTPTITDLRVDLGEGPSLVFASAAGKLSRGEELRILARTHDDLPEVITVSGQFAGEPFRHAFKAKPGKGEAGYVIEQDGVVPRLVPRLWAKAYVDSLLTDTRGLDAVRGKVLTLGYEYGLMTPFTSFLALESESAYAQAGIERRRRNFPQLTADASWSRHGEAARAADGERDDPTVLSMILGTTLAPMGCVMKDAASDAAGRSDDDAEANLRYGSPASRPSTTPSITPTLGRLEADNHPVGDRDARELEAGWGDAPSTAEEATEVRRHRNARGVFHFDDKTSQAIAAYDGLRGLDETVALQLPRQMAGATTEAELLRRSYAGKPRVLDPGIARDRAAACSDASTRSMSTRRRLWARQLDRHASMSNMLQAYEAAVATCEIERWRDQKTFLDLLQARARTEAEIQLLLGHFAGDEDATTFLTQALLRRLVDANLIATVVYAKHGLTVDWFAVDLELRQTDDPRERLEILDRALRRSPGDPDGERRMIRELVAQDRRDEAITRGLGLRAQGQVTPELTVVIGDLLAAAGRDDEARRLYSELVEYAPDSLPSRQLVGDLFLRHHWFADAYRQYELLLARAETPDSAIRLARAAAGTGRTDEALRLLKRVYSGEGRPGIDDPRRWAKLHAAAILAALLDAEIDVPRSKLVSELKGLKLSDGPATWEILTWDDLGADLVLVPDYEADPDRAIAPDADRVDATGTGLYAIQPAGDHALVVRHAGLVPDRGIAWRRTTLRWAGEAFTVESEAGTIEAKEAASPNDSEDASAEDGAEPAG